MNAEANSHWGDEQIRRMLSERQPEQELRLGQLACFRQRNHPLSERMAGEMRGGDYTTFNNVMAALVRDGMRPLNEEDMGVFASWLILNVPYEQLQGETMVDARFRIGHVHEGICARLGCWHFAATRDASPEDRVNTGRVFSSVMDGVYAKPQQVRDCRQLTADAFGGDRLQHALELIAPAEPPVFEIFTRETSQRTFLTEEAVDAGRREGWYRDPGTPKRKDSGVVGMAGDVYQSYESHLEDVMMRGVMMVQQMVTEALGGDPRRAPREATDEVLVRVQPRVNFFTPHAQVLMPAAPRAVIAEHIKRLRETLAAAGKTETSNMLSECQQLQAGGDMAGLSERLLTVLEHQEMLGAALPADLVIPDERRALRLMGACDKRGNKEAARLVADGMLCIESGNRAAAAGKLLDAIEELTKRK